MRRTLLIALSTVLVVTLAGPADAAWTPDADAWPTFRRDARHGGEATGTSLFTPGPGDFARQKWQSNIDYPALGPPTVADLDADGTPEVVVMSSDVRAQIGPPPNIDFNHKVEALEGDDGAVDWAQDEGDSFAFALPAHLGQIDADNSGEVVYFRGNPLTGTPATNRVIARSHTGAQQWQFADGDWNALQHPVGIITGIHSANLDNEAANDEVLATMTQADFLINTVAAGPGCANPNKILIEASNISYFVHAINGEGGSAAPQWERHEDGLLGSTPLVGDLNGDAKNDVVWGAGAPQGPIIPSCTVEVSVDESAEDNRVLAVNGNTPPNLLWTFSLEDPAGTPRPVPATPVQAGTTAGGDPVLAFLVPVPGFAPAPNDRNILLALNGETGAELWRLDIGPATIAPLAVANLDGIGQPEILVQVGDRIATFRNDGTDFWSQGTGPGRGVVYARTLTSAGLAIADLDSDGTKEIATILDGSRTAGQPKSELLVVSGTDGAVEWTKEITQDEATGGPVIADVDNDDDLLEIVVSTGFFTVTDAQAHTGKAFAFEPNAPDLEVTDIELLGSQIVNEPQTVRVHVRNSGTREGANAAFRLRDGGTDIGTQTVTLAAGATTQLDYPWTPVTHGNHNLVATGDPANLIRELQENDNERPETFRIKARPAADFTFSPDTPLETQTVQFTDQSTDPDNQMLSSSWSCTDGFTSNQTNPSHKFADGGSYQCTLTVTDTDGLGDSETKSIVVTHVTPVADFTSEILDPGEVQLTDTSTHPNGPDAPPAGWTYAWDFEDDGTFDSAARSPFHDYGVDEGVFSVRLRVTDNDGIIDEVVKTIDVALVNEPPTANFTSSQPAVAGHPITFSDQSSDPDGQIVKIEVDLDGDGDIDRTIQGNNVAGSQFQHTYPMGGNFNVAWTVTDDRGATATETKIVHVCQPPGNVTTGPGISVNAELCAGA